MNPAAVNPEAPKFLSLLSESDRDEVVVIIRTKRGYREIAAEVLARWPTEAGEAWGIWVGYPEGVGMDLVEALKPRSA